MKALVASLATLAMLPLGTLNAHADEAPSQETVDAAAQVNVDAWDLEGALNVSRDACGCPLSVMDYLYGTNLLERPYAAPQAPPPSLVSTWISVAECESNQRWHIATGNGYWGGLQEDMVFWGNYGYVDHPGGALMAPRPDLATPAQQMLAAERGLARQGWGAWPRCSRRLGLR